VRAGGGGDGSGLHLISKFVEGRRGQDTELRGVLLRDGAVGVVNRGELRGSKLRIKPCVIFSDVANADHADARLFHVVFSRNHL
jgi:hypothetical protein